MVKRFVVPFASTGDKSVTPDATDPAGAISYSQGWGAQYQLPNSDPSYRPVGRQEMNGVLNDITGAIAEIQTLGFPEWVAVTGLVTPYAINAEVRHNDVNWRNTVANNSVEPGTDATWVVANQPYTLATAGASPAFTLAPTPALAAYATGQRFRVSFNATPVGVPTLNVSGRGAKNLKQYNALGAKVQAVIAAGQISDVEYDGVDMVVLQPLTPNLFKDLFNYISIRALGLTYTNTTDRPIVAMVELLSTSTNQSCVMIINSGGGDVTFVGSSFPTSGYSVAGTFIIPAGATYRVNTGAYNLNRWAEIR